MLPLVACMPKKQSYLVTGLLQEQYRADDLLDPCCTGYATVACMPKKQSYLVTGLLQDNTVLLTCLTLTALAMLLLLVCQKAVLPGHGSATRTVPC